MEERTCDIIVLGGGPAGMTAAIYAKRANLDVVLLETNVTGGLVNSTYTVENFPSYPEIHGMELMEKMREHVDHMGVEVEEVFEVTGLELGEDEKAVHGDGIVYKAPAIILATGRIVGETAALIYTASSVAKIPTSVFSSTRTLAVHMYLLSNEGLYIGQTYGTAVVLLVLVLVINCLSGFVAGKLTKQ